jgi:cytochrome c biogenesis protein CcmG, thiol:disulfide interchange protein DsbE
MTARQQWSVVGAVVLLLGLALFAATRLLGNELFPVVVGSDAPPLRAVTLDAAKRPVTLADYKGKVVLLNVWATWCEPCRVEMPSIEKLHREFGARGLSVVAVSVDDAGTEDHIREFASELGLTFQIVHDPTQATKAAWQVAGYPETFIIGREGKIRKKVIGAADWSSEANRALLRELLGTSTAAR